MHIVVQILPSGVMEDVLDGSDVPEIVSNGDGVLVRTYGRLCRERSENGGGSVELNVRCITLCQAARSSSVENARDMCI